MNTSTSTPHLDDGVLVRIIDGQLLPGDDPAHLAECQRCRTRYEELGRRSTALSRRLAREQAAHTQPPTDLRDRIRERVRTSKEIDPSGSRRAGNGASPLSSAIRAWKQRPVLRAAILAAVLVAPLAAEPVRDWVGRSTTRLAAAIGLLDTTKPPTGDGEVTILPTGERLVVRVYAPQPGAALVIRFQDRPDALARIPDDPTASLVALPDGFRVLNSAGGPGVYRIAAPAGRPVEVRVAGSVVAVVTGSAGEERTVPLAPDGP